MTSAENLFSFFRFLIQLVDSLLQAWSGEVVVKHIFRVNSVVKLDEKKVLNPLRDVNNFFPEFFGCKHRKVTLLFVSSFRGEVVLLSDAVLKPRVKADKGFDCFFPLLFLIMAGLTALFFVEHRDVIQIFYFILEVLKNLFLFVLAVLCLIVSAYHLKLNFCCFTL